jgi:hypothetical protein
VPIATPYRKGTDMTTLAEAISASRAFVEVVEGTFGIRAEA